MDGRLIKSTMILDKIHPSWMTAIGDEFNKPYFRQLSEFLRKERLDHTVFPPEEDVFNALSYPLNTIRVCIIGQDPYINKGQANGLCFSVQNGKAPPSLRNIFKELSDDPEITFRTPEIGGDLTPWAEQGVLMLNTVFTVSSGKANSHARKGWEEFTSSVLRAVHDHQVNIVFMLWGSSAHKKGSHIDTERHTVIKTVHPSPLSAYKGWFGCGCFSRCNETLCINGNDPINWQI